MNDPQLELFHLHVEETEGERTIRAFAEGGMLGKAGEFFRAELVRILCGAADGCDDPEYRRVAAFGRRVLGNEMAEPILLECLNRVKAELERAVSSQRQQLLQFEAV